MLIKRKIRHYFELLIVSLIISIIDIFFMDNPGFYKNNYLLYWLIPIIFTLIYGKKWIFTSIITTIITFFITFFISMSIFKSNGRFFDTQTYIKNFPATLATVLLVLYIISIMLSRYTLQIDSLKSRVKVLSLESLRYKRSTKALEIVNSEFESQISRSQDSITRLYSQVEKLNKLNTDYILQTFLETIQEFTKINKATVWEYDDDKTRLNLVSSVGYNGDEPGPYMAINGTVEGYVYRNNQFFTIRKIGDYQSITIKNAKYNIMTIPINIGRKVWGILNIEQIPFEKYSRYCEQLIQIIVNLTEAPLEKALDFERMIKSNDLDIATGLPLYSQFYSLLENKLNLSWKDGSSLSIVIFDLLNLAELSENKYSGDIFTLFTESLIAIFNDASHDFFFFRYKEKSQIVLISSNLDQDGISFYLVKVYRKFSESIYRMDNIQVSFNIAVGYATQNEKKLSADTILKEADNLLDMSKM